MMKVDTRQIEEARDQMEKMDKELREILDEIDEVTRDLDRHQIGSSFVTEQFKRSLRSERIRLMTRSVGLMSLSMALLEAVRNYEACEQKAKKHSEESPWFKSIVLPISPHMPKPISPISIVDTIDRFIVPLMGQEGR